MPVFKLSANLSMLFHEAGSLVERYAAAAQAGFSGVECAYVYDYEPEQLAAALQAAGIEQTLINGHYGRTAVTASITIINP